MLLAGMSAPAGVNEGSYEILENGAGKFRVEVQDPPGYGRTGESFVLGGVESVDIDDIVFDIKVAEASTGAGQVRRGGAGAGGAYRVYGPGDAHYGSITISMQAGAGSPDLYQWWLDTSSGRNIRKNISVIALKRDGSEARRFNFIECFPTRWEAADYSPSSGEVSGETIVVKIGRVEMAIAGDDNAGDPPLDPGVYAVVEPAAVLDPPWEGWSGGTPVRAVPVMPGSRYHTSTPGHKYIDTLTLRGPLTSGRKAMMEWINATVRGNEWKRKVVVTEITADGSDGKTYNYLDCFPTRYVFPAFSASGTGNLYEEISIKPIRLDLS